MNPAQELAKAIAENDVAAAGTARALGAPMPRLNAKHPVFSWLRLMRGGAEDAMPMLQWLVANGLDPAFRIQARADRLPAGDFSASLSNRVTRRHGDKGDDLLGRLIYCCQFAAVDWLAGRVPARSLFCTHEGAPDTLDSPLERLMHAGQWGSVSAILDRLRGYQLEEDDALHWRAIHARALKIQLSTRPLGKRAQAQLDRIFQMSAQAGASLPGLAFIPPEAYLRKVPASSLDAWSRNLSGTAGFLFDTGHRHQRDGWAMLFSSPASYREATGMLRALLRDHRFGAVASRQYDLLLGRARDTTPQGTLCDLAMSVDIDIASPEDRAIVVDLLRQANCAPSRPAGDAFKQIMAKGDEPGNWMPVQAWRQYPGELPENAISLCRRSRQLKQLLAWGMDPAAPSAEGVPALVDLLKSMRARQASQNLQDLAIEVGDLLQARPELLGLACPQTGERVSDLAWAHSSISSRVASATRCPQITAWSLVSACVGGQKPDLRMTSWIEQRQQQGSGALALPGTDITPWFASVLLETAIRHRRTSAQQNNSRQLLDQLERLGKWPGGSAMEGLRRLSAARDMGMDRPALQSTTFAHHFKPGEISQSIQSLEDVDFLAKIAVAEGRKMLELLHHEIIHMDPPCRAGLFCSWAAAARQAVDQSIDGDYHVDLEAAFPHDSVMYLVDHLIQDTALDTPDLDRIMAAGYEIAKLEQESPSPNREFEEQLLMRISHFSMHRQTQKAMPPRPPGKRF